MKIRISTSTTLESVLKDSLLKLPEFADWKKYPEKLKVSVPEYGVLDVQLQKTDKPLTLSPRDIRTTIPNSLNMLGLYQHFIAGHIMSGSPTGGHLRFTYK